MEAEAGSLQATAAGGLFAAADTVMKALMTNSDRQAKQIEELQKRAEDLEAEVDRLRDGEDGCQRKLAAAQERIRLLEAASFRS